MTPDLHPWLAPALALGLAPLLPGVINKVKAMVGGRRGPPLLQLYYDLAKLAAKGAVYSRTTTWLFRAGPLVTLAATLLALSLGSAGGPVLWSFPGDLVVVFALLALGRFFTILAALDTGSSFEGMGASREAQFSALVEPALFLVFATLARLTGTFSLAGIFSGLTPAVWTAHAAVPALAAVALGIVLLAENARIPVDDPATHLELTMIHEVMTLDHSGPDYALILYGAALKLWLFASWLSAVILPRWTLPAAAGLALHLAGIVAVAIGVGLVESSLARLRLLRVPQLLFGALALGVVAFLLTLDFGRIP